MNVTDMFSLKGKNALITGGSGLYGRQMVLSLAQAGAKVYTASRNLENNKVFAAMLRKVGLTVYAMELNQGDEESVLQLRDNLLKKEEYIDILVNNAVIRPMKLGMAYGINNERGMPDEAESFAILDTAIEGGITVLNTAAAYGKSEQVIGNYLKQTKYNRPTVVTKAIIGRNKGSKMS